MTKVKMQGYRVSELNFVNKLDNGAKVQFGNKFSYHVKYGTNDNCIGELSVEMFDKDRPEQFGVKIVINGFFQYNKSEKKENIHVLTYKELFPFARSIVASVSVNAGIPPIILPTFDIESQSIYKFEKNI